MMLMGVTARSIPRLSSRLLCPNKTYVRHHHLWRMQLQASRTTVGRLGIVSMPWGFVSRRTLIGPVLRTLPRILKLRYLILGGTVGGGAAASRKYEEWKDKLPDTSWIREYFPKNEDIRDRFSSYWSELKAASSKLRSKASLPDQSWLPVPVVSALAEGFQKVKMITDDIQRRFSQGNAQVLLSSGQMFQEAPELVEPVDVLYKEGQSNQSSSSAAAAAAAVQDPKDIQDELMALQIQYQHEIDRLERENRELRRQVMLKVAADSDASTKVIRSMRRSPIDMYSEVLDEMSMYDTTYDTQDHLPRVVVVGDQSSGKTSVLEMIAQARIFPRGSGEMMTRAPVMVTLSEGPFHVAKFRDSPREYDLSKEAELSSLRREVEIRMRNSVHQGQTISQDVISMTVKGPGLQRMVLVDLPGIISTVTTGMSSDTKTSIQTMCRKYMENPNAIILCIQDGSIDAERSNVTDLVSSIDIEGKRTIFVLTKVDLAETSLYNPDRIRKILDGKLFPMKALGYFAVVTGRGNQNDSISSIKQYEEEFFKTSKLFKDGVLKPTQMTTRNLSLAVSNKFWRMVQDSVEQQADVFKATRYNLETEWKNTYPGTRELDRIELFEKAKCEILDQLISLSQINSKEWEDSFLKQLWDRTSAHVFESIYLPASSSANIGSFNTAVDIKLKQWADQALPRVAVDVGVHTLRERFMALLQSDRGKCDEVLEPLKIAVVEEVFKRHLWDSKAEDSLRVLQQLCLEDRSIHSKVQWESAVNFMERNLSDMQTTAKQKLAEMTGPSVITQWTGWKYRSTEQADCVAVKAELERLLGHERHRKPQMSPDEMTTIKKNLQAQSISVSDDMIKDTWHHLYRQQFLTDALATARMCRKAFGFYQKGLTPAQCGLDCKDVELFWRVEQMLQTTSNALRQQVVNHEARRLERIMKEVLDDLGDDNAKLEQLLSGKRVKLAEELKRVRHIQDKLEEFIQCLNRDKS